MLGIWEESRGYGEKDGCCWVLGIGGIFCYIFIFICILYKFLRMCRVFI